MSAGTFDQKVFYVYGRACNLNSNSQLLGEGQWLLSLLHATNVDNIMTETQE